MRGVERQPNGWRLQVKAAVYRCKSGAGLEGAMPVIRRAREILQENPGLFTSDQAAHWLAAFGIWEKWMAGDVKGALTEADTVGETLLQHQSQGVELRHNATFLAHMYLALGKLDAAEEVFSRFFPRGVHAASALSKALPVLLAFQEGTAERL